MVKRPVRNYKSDKNIAPRVFDVIIEGDKVLLEIKLKKDCFERMLWKDVQYQVESFIAFTNREQ